MTDSIIKRRNGFSPPYTKAQMSTWVALLASIIEFFLFITPILAIEVSVPVSVFFAATAIATTYYGLLTQLKDPIDVHLRRYLEDLPGTTKLEDRESPFLNLMYKKCNTKKKEADTVHANALPIEEMKQCWICDTQVAEHSMHCKFCNKCVYHFDHHCIWLNTCIGANNYKYFFRTMCFIFMMEFIHIGVQLFLIIDIFAEGPSKDRADNWFNADAAYFMVGVMIFFACFNALSIFLIGQLLIFHLALQRKQLTTYQFIVNEHQRKRNELREREELTGKRATEIAKARQEGRMLRVCSLRMGGFCRNQLNCAACDPLELGHKNEGPPAMFHGFAGSLGDNEHGEAPQHEPRKFLPPSQLHEPLPTENGQSFVKVDLSTDLNPTARRENKSLLQKEAPVDDLNQLASHM